MDDEQLCMRERMAIVETKVDDIKKDVSGVKADVKEVKELIMAQDDKFARKEELNDLKNKVWWIVGIIVTIILALKLTHII